jgi:hypothetical protein
MDPELAEALRLVLGLPVAEQLRCFEMLAEDLSGDFGTETEVGRQVQARSQALDALRRAAELLSLGVDQAPTVADYNRVAAAHDLGLTAAQIRKAFGRWETARAALLGQWIPLTAAQRAVRRAICRRQGDETYRGNTDLHLDALQLWLKTAPTDRCRSEYDAWHDLENERRLGQGLTPLPRAETIRMATRTGWDQLLRVAEKELTLNAVSDSPLTSCSTRRSLSRANASSWSSSGSAR